MKLRYNYIGDFMDGIILVRKERNMTSHDVVNRLRKILGTKKVGHSGTLDPNVEGVLCVFVNKATKAIQFMEDKSKQYHGIMKFGAITTTEDSDGEIVESVDVELPLDEERLKRIAASFIGKRKQIPPMVSSVKVNGKKLYEYYREGIEVDRPVRDIEITNFEIISINGDEVEFVVDCSSGTYVRTLCVDVAKEYGTLGHMKSLVRTRVGTFTIDKCKTLDEIAAGNYSFLSVKEALSGIPTMYAEGKFKEDILNGKSIRIDSEHDLLLICDEKEALAIYKRKNGYIFGCERGLW